MQLFKILREIKSVSFATISGRMPRVRIIDVMLVEDEKIYFLTTRGKPFYKQLLEGGIVAAPGMTPAYLVVRLNGQIRQVERKWLDRIFEANTMMNDLYPGEKRDILEAFWSDMPAFSGQWHRGWTTFSTGRSPSPWGLQPGRAALK